MNCIIDDEEFLILENEKFSFKFTFQNTYNKNISFENAKIIGVFYNKMTIIKRIPLEVKNLTAMQPNEEKVIEASFVSPQLDDNTELYFRVAIQFYGLPERYQGNEVNIKLIK